MKKFILLSLALVLVFSLSACGTAIKKNEISSIVLSSTEISVSVGETAPLLAEITPAESKDELTWKSSDENVAKYYDGEILGKGKGTCKIIATTPNGVSAECTVTVKGKVVNTGSCGENVTWTYYDDYSLVFSGTGDMTEYYKSIWYQPNNVIIPWHSYSPFVKEIIVEEGITSICGFAFVDCKAAESIKIADSVEKIGHCAFEYATNIKNLIISKNVKKLGSLIFHSCDFNVFYSGNEQDFNNVEKETDKDKWYYDYDENGLKLGGMAGATWDGFFNGKLLYFSETEKVNSWHYVNGIPTPW